jgi:hypothetical protein
MQELIKASWTGKLGSRAIGGINGTLNLLIEHQKTHPQSTGYEREEAVTEFIAKMPGPLRREVLSYVDMRAREQTRQQNLQEEST